MRLLVVHARLPKKWEGQWVYLGNSYLSLMSWERRVSGRRYSLSQEVREQAEIQRQPFLNWIEEQRLANNDSLRWWMTHLAGRHYHGSMLFLYICQVSALRSWVDRRSDIRSQVMVVCEDVFLMQAVRDNLAINHQVVMQPSWQFAWIRRLGYSLARAALSLIRQLRSLLRHHRVARITRPRRLTPPTGEVYLMHLTLGNKAFRQNGKIICPYFTILPAWLESQGKTVVRLPWINQIDVPLLEGYRKLRESDCLVPEDWLTVKDYIIALWNSLAVFGSLKRSVIYQGLNINKLTFREKLQQMYDGRAEFWRYGPMLERWGRSLDKITLIDTFENMTPEHVQIAQLRKLGSKFRAIGYYHSLIGRDFLGYHFPPREWQSPILPDVIITNSVLGRKTLIEQGAPEDRVKVGPALRQQFREVGETERISRNYLLIPLPTLLLDAAFEVLEKVAVHADWLATQNIPVLVKPHPLSKIKDILDYLQWENLPTGWQWSHGEIQDALKLSYCCITLATASAFDALLAGCIVIPLMSDTNFAHNVLDLLEDDFPELTAISSGQLKGRINDIFCICRDEYIKRFSLIRKRMLDGCGGQTDEEMAKFL